MGRNSLTGSRHPQKSTSAPFVKRGRRFVFGKRYLRGQAFWIMFWASLFALTILTVTVCVLIFADALYIRPAVILCAALLATTGWVSIALINIFSERQRYTASLLSEYRLDETLNAHIQTIHETFPPGRDVKNVTEARALLDLYGDGSAYRAQGQNLGYSIIFVLNHLEMMARQYRRNVVDRKFISFYFDNILYQWMMKFRYFIKAVRDEQGEDTRAFYEAICLFVHLYQHDRKKQDGVLFFCALENPDVMNVLLIGSGGREHAMAWRLSQSPSLRSLYCSPGSDAISTCAQCVDLEVNDHEVVLAFCREKNIDLVVVGPEAPLVAGLADKLQGAGIDVFGPTKAAAQLEGSKRFTKELCRDHNIPTADYAHFDNAAEALSHVRNVDLPVVIKADGLAAGKGVTIAETREQAERAINDCFSGAFGDAGAEVVIEEFLVGEEASFFVLTDGTTILPLATAQDHKRVFDGDKGPNTGGMGAYSPAPVMTPDLVRRTLKEIIEPTIKGMSEKGMAYTGVLYAGLMITAEGPKLIEYNVRFGDPECQVLMMRLNSDLLPALAACARGDLNKIDLQWRDEAALTVVMASQGYPGGYEKGSVIGGLETAQASDDIQIFHAGTKFVGNDVLANGGRVLNVTALGETIEEAQLRAYMAIDRIDWSQGHYRRDIAWRALRS